MSIKNPLILPLLLCSSCMVLKTRGGREGEEGEREQRGRWWLKEEGNENSLGQSVSRAWDQSEELWCGVDKVEDLGDEEEEHGLAEVAEDGDHCKRHASEVAVCVTNEHSGGIPVGGEVEGVCVQDKLNTSTRSFCLG